jgi:phosphoesterase RecJ-like protein
MTTYQEAEKIQSALAAADKIVIVQADNPDGDSLASSLALEEILSTQGKNVVMFCGVDIPSYLRYLPGADRVVSELPKQFDLSLIVDTSSDSLLEQLGKQGAKSWLAARPAIICNHPAVATGEVIYELAAQLRWDLNEQAKEMLAVAILSDSLGLTSEATTARSIHIIAELVEGGVMLAQLEHARRETMRREQELVNYKGELLQRVEFHAGGRVATITIPQDEIVKYSPLYNPPMLVLDDMRLAKDTAVAIAFKVYDDGKITAKIRCNYGFAIADKLAEYFGGGGHSYAAGFKIQDGKNFDELKKEVINEAALLLDGLETPEL